MFPDDEDVNVVGMDKPFELLCSMVDINNVFIITLQASQATKIDNQLFNRLLNEGIFVIYQQRKKKKIENTS